MKGLINYSVEKMITVLMVVLAVIIFGVVSFTRLTTDLFPAVNIPYAVVVTTYPGATPDEVEQVVSIPLENTLQTTTNIQEVTTTSQENFSLTMLEFAGDTDMDTAVIEMRESLNMLIDSWPDSVGYPQIIRLNPDMLPVMNFSVGYQGMDLEELTQWVENDLSPRLERVPGVASLNISGAYESEIRVTLDQEAIDQYNDEIKTMLENVPNSPDFSIDKEHVNNILEAQNFSFPAGFVNVNGIDYMVRVGDDLESLEEIEELLIFNFDIPFMELPTIRLNDIASIESVNASERSYSKVNGDDAITITIQKGSDYATTEVAEGVNNVLDEVMDEDSNVDFTVLLDQGEYIEMSTGNVINNLLLGGILAILILFIFLRNFRVTFIVGVAIPVSLLAAIIMIYLSGITLNIVSLGGLALGIGMLVDNSIVVMENIFRMKKDGKSNKEASVRGAYQVAGAVTASTLTTIGVFLPIIFIEDFVRDIFVQLGLTIAFSLLASLVISLTLVPTIANKILKEKQEPIDKNKKTPFFDKVKGAYGVALKGLFKVKIVVIIAVMILFGLSIYASTSRGFEFFPATDEGTLNITIEMDANDPLEFNEFTETLDQISTDIASYRDVESVGITVGGGDMMMLMGSGGGENTATANVVLRSDRNQTTTEMRDDIAEMLEGKYTNLFFEVAGTEADTEMLIGTGIQVRLTGLELDTLREEASGLQALLQGVEGVREVDPGFGQNTEEIKITVDKDLAMENSLTVAQVLGIVSQTLQGPEVVTEVRLNGSTYDVYVYDELESERVNVESIAFFENLVVGQDMATEEPILLSDIASIDIEPGYSSITRINGVRALTISATLDTDANATLVSDDVEEILEDYQLPTGYDYELLGENEEIMAALTNLLLVGAIGIILVYMIMASQFQSLTYPFIIMITVPLAFTGGLGALYIFGMPVSIVSVIGLIILAGVVVNNGIVLVDYINQLRERGRSLEDAIIEAGKTRLRPIFMTALTTILALTGLAIGIGEGAELMQPMAITSVGGLIYATFLTIFVVPIMYYSVSRNGRYIFGLLLSALGLGAGIYFFINGEILYGSLGIAVVILSVLLMLFLPKKKAVHQDNQPLNFDDLVEKAGLSDES